jgi:hypothetical protein
MADLAKHNFAGVLTEQIPAVAGHILYPERGGGLLVPVITASSQATGGTLGKCPQLQQRPDEGVPEQVNVASRPQARLGRDTEHLRVHNCELVPWQELIDQQRRPRRFAGSGEGGGLRLLR